MKDESVDLIVHRSRVLRDESAPTDWAAGRIVGKYQDAGKADSKWFAEFHDNPEVLLR